MTSARIKQTSARRPALVDPIARLLVDVPLAHLDRPFDYLVPEELSAAVVVGGRVRVRFAGRLVDAYVLERGSETDHDGQLAYLERTVGDEPVLTPETTRLVRAVADRYAGSFVDVARLAIPPRHARTESAPVASAWPWPQPPDASAWSAYRAGSAFLGAITAGRSARAVWSATAGEQWPQRLAEAAQAALAAGRGAVLVVPDVRDLARLDAALSERLGAGRHVALSADLGPAERYRRWLAVRRGAVRAVIGTRAAAFAPVLDPGLLAIWDDGDDLHDEPRAPYPSTRDVLVLRSSLSGAALLIGGFARSAEAHQLVESGWAHDIAADRATIRRTSPTVSAIGDDFEQERDPAARAARLPSLAWRTAREALAAGHPVLVQVPRSGYVPSLACARDRLPARCVHCSGPLSASSGHAIPTCRWCGRPAGDWVCPNCGGRRMRAVVIGAARTVEELGRAFPGVAVRSSGGDAVLTDVPAAPALVVATPGAEPVADGGYGAALLLDGWALLARPDLRAGEETLRRWANAVALVRVGGRVVVGADPAVAAVQALIRWDAAGFAARELADRRELGFPPASRMASLTGTPAAVAEFVAALRMPDGAEILGSVPSGPELERALVRAPRSVGLELAVELKAAAATRSARKAPDPVRVQLDPRELF